MQDNSQENTNTGSPIDPPTPEGVVAAPLVEVSTPVDERVHHVDGVDQSKIEITPEQEPALITAEPVLISGVTKKSRALKQYAIAGVIVLLMGIGVLYVMEEQGRVKTGVFATVNELIKPMPAAAVVNGVKIPLSTYEKNRAQIEKNATTQGLTVTDEAVKTEITKQAIDVLVNTELLKQAAAKADIKVTQEQIDTRYGEIVTSLGGEEALKAKMIELGITDESLQSDIKGEILIQGYLSKAVDLSKITVSEEDIKKVYDQANTPGAKLPPLAEVKADIEAQLKSTKEQELVNTQIETLRKDAKIETKV